jgi:putative ABC transport system ATP-binding protein
MVSPQPTIVAQHIHKSVGPSHNRQTVLQGVSLTVAAGETVYLVGPSGSGKTTLLSILGCILRPDCGKVEVLGQDVTRMTDHQLTAFRGRTIGFVFQTFNLFPNLSALDNIRLALAMQGASLTAATARATALLNQVGLAHRLHTRPGQLSSGECQRVAIARALASDPPILFADEPTAALDAENGQAVMELLTQLVRERGRTLVVVTHDERIYPFADCILRLENGRLTDEWMVRGAQSRPSLTLEEIAL